MNDKNLNDWFLAQEIRRMHLANTVNLAHSSHDVGDMPDTRGYSPFIVDGDDVADPDSLRPFEAICFKSEEQEVIATAVNLMLDRNIEFNGKFYTSRELDEILTKGELTGLDLFMHDMAMDAEEEADCAHEVDLGPAAITGRKLIVLNQGFHQEKSPAVLRRMTQAKSSCLKQDHRHRPTADLPMLASMTD